MDFSIAVDILCLAARHHPQLLDALLLPSGLDLDLSVPNPNSSAPPLLLLGAPPAASSGATAASGSGPVTVPGRGVAWSALDGLYELLSVGRDQHPEVSLELGPGDANVFAFVCLSTTRCAD